MRIVREGVGIHYELVGETDKPVLVMLHGFGNNIQNWYDFGYVEKLQPHFRLLMIDVRGFGESDKPLTPEAYSLENIAADVIAIMDAEDIAKAHCYGVSIAAFYVYYLATHFQGRFESFIFQNYAPSNMFEIKQMLSDILEKYKDVGIKEYVDGLSNAFGIDFPAHVRQAMEMCDTQALYAVSVATWNNCADQLAQITAPCLLLMAENEGAPDYSEQVVVDIKNCQLEVLLGFDHVALTWAGDKVAPIITQFIQNQNSLPE